MITRVLNITAVKRDLLRLVDADAPDVVVTRGGEPVGRLLPGVQPEVEPRRPALVVLGAKPCEPAVREACCRSIRRVASRFSCLVWVHGGETAAYPDEIADLDILAVETEKTGQPIITSLKAGLSCLPAAGGGWFMYLFLNRPVPPTEIASLLDGIPDAAAKGRGIVVPLRAGSPGHPLIFSLRYKPLIMGTRKELGVPYIIRRHRDDIFFISL
ncbi:MAG: NTP transferase domain-containing protein [Deltaproteobacteria bacterium]|nr:NTP transferase domain-containing protein [Candidatus Anaeroferrophillacea bacterium]